MKSPFLTKSSFKTARECPTKLYYKTHGYPNTNDEDEYLELLADGGYMIGKMAQLLYPGGYLVAHENNTDAVSETEEKLKEDQITLFEPAIYTNNKLVRIDILIKDKNRFQLIEVKSKSFDSAEYQAKAMKGKSYFDDKNWQPYVEDVAFQKLVLQEKFPDSIIECFLLMPDKNKTNPIEGLIGWFEIDRKAFEKYTSIKVNFKGDAEQLRKDHFLEWVNIDEEVEVVFAKSDFKASVNTFIQSLVTDTKITTPISVRCKDCEYRLSDDRQPNGFRECWGVMADIKPHILNLGYLGNFNKKGEVTHLIDSGKAGLDDVPPGLVEGKYDNRPYYQLTEKEEFIKPEFFRRLSDIKYPLWFIDFETSQMAVPYHAGMHPYGRVIFQWSCHAISQKDAAPVHHEWINIHDSYPNFEFARKLKECIGDEGTILTWTKYENTQLRDINKTMGEWNHNEPELLDWLGKLVNRIEGSHNRFIDMNEWAKKYYFHPAMGARTSIKVTLPAVLQSVVSPEIKKYLQDEGLYQEANRVISNPYQLLPEIDIAGKSESVSEGMGAMRAYQDMLYGIYKNEEEIREIYRRALLTYCKLDTLAMVIIWEHWINGKVTRK
jgi:hypothetical protein